MASVAVFGSAQLRKTVQLNWRLRNSAGPRSAWYFCFSAFARPDGECGRRLGCAHWRFACLGRRNSTINTARIPSAALQNISSSKHEATSLESIRVVQVKVGTEYLMIQ